MELLQSCTKPSICAWVWTQVLSAPISSLSLLLVQTQGAHLYLDIAKSGYLFHGYSSGMCLCIHISMGRCKKDETLVRYQWSFVFFCTNPSIYKWLTLWYSMLMWEHWNPFHITCPFMMGIHQNLQFLPPPLHHKYNHNLNFNTIRTK